MSFMQAIRVIFQQEGFKGYLRGFTPSMLKNTLNAGTYFGLLYYFEHFF